MKIAILSDIHANAYALDTVLEHAFEKQRCSQLFFLGDLLGYGAMPVETITSFAKHLDISSIIKGNHEDLVSRLWAYFSGMEGAIFSAENVALFKQANSEISRRAVASCLSNLDELLQYIDDPGISWYLDWINSEESQNPSTKNGINRSIQLSHGSHKEREICYLYSWQNPFMVNNFHVKPLMEQGQSSPITFVGHTHIPMISSLKDDWEFRRSEQIIYGEPIALADSFYVINSGSVGFPRDGDARASYAVLDTDPWTITFFRLAYDRNRVRNAMIRKQYDMESIRLFMESPFPNELLNGIEDGLIDPKYLRELEERKEMPGE
jgi:predicted phosphodiesterase